MTTTFSLQSDETSGELQDVVDRLLAQVDVQAVPTGILHWTPAAPFRPHRFNGGPRCESMQMPAWRALHFRMTEGALPGTSMTSTAELRTRAEHHRGAGRVPIALANLQYTNPRRRFIASVLRDVEAGKPVEDPDPEDLADVLEHSRAVFAAAYVKEEWRWLQREPIRHYGRSVRYRVPRDLYVHNDPTDAAPTLEIDFDDGAGWQPIAFDQDRTVRYANVGTKHCRLRIRTDGEPLLARFHVEVLDSTVPTVDETWTQLSTDGFDATGTAWVFYGSGNSELTNPVLFSEGFPGGYSLDYLWTALNQENMATDMLALGFDLVIIGYGDGTKAIEQNAGVVIAAIQKAITEVRASSPGTTPNLMVGGASMGGLLTRYALTYMEFEGIPHYTSKYFSIDTPHTGAVVPPSAQYFVQYFAPSDPNIGDAQTLLNSPAALEQSLVSVTSYNEPNPVPNPVRTEFVAKLRAIGWNPKQPTCFAIASGMGNGTGNGAAAGAEALYWKRTCAGCYLYTLPGYDWRGSNLVAETWYVGTTWYLYATGSWANMDSAPGGTGDTFSTLATGLTDAGYDPDLTIGTTCFIPTISALAMDSLSPMVQGDLFQDIGSDPGTTWLDAFSYAETSNLQHIEIDGRLAAWLLEQFGSPADTSRAVRETG